MRAEIVFDSSTVCECFRNRVCAKKLEKKISSKYKKLWVNNMFEGENRNNK